MTSPLTEPLAQLVRASRAAARDARWIVGVACAAGVAVAALLVARQGTLPWRVAGATSLTLAIAAAVVWEPLLARRMRDAKRFLLGPVAEVDAARAHRALRALSFVGPDGELREEGTSRDLARLHVQRALAELPATEVIRRSSRWAFRLQLAALAIGCCALLVALVRAPALLEGADILLARHGVAPLPLSWLEGVEVNARPPEYLHQGEVNELMMGALSLPYGTAVAVRGTPSRAGRRLLLSDGATEVPFVEDGTGAVVARWPLTKSVTLRAVARFGEVVIPAPEVLPIESIADIAPVVELENAPSRIRLVDASADVPIRYRASDDHGLREIHLVLRSGPREERRVLAHLDGDARSFQGGNVLRVRDPFVTKSHVPVSVTVEGEDNDPLTGPKWGSSEAIVLVPPDVGEPEAMRLTALRALRDALVDVVAAASDAGGAKDADSRNAAARDAADREAALEKRWSQVAGGSYGGVRVPSRIRALIEAQAQAARKAVDAEGRAPGETTHAATLKAVERFALVVDAVIHGTGERDTRTSAKALADVADDLAAAESDMRNDTASHPRGAARVEAGFEVLAGGGLALAGLGELGRDIGEIVDADLLRVRRAGLAGDFAHAELAARDLAARLRQPDPSFGSRGGSGRAGGRRSSGSESGNGSSGEDGEDGDSADDVQQAFDQAVQDLDRLAREHAGHMGKMEEALSEAESDDDAKDAREEARRHAEAVREVARRLPAVGLGSDSWTSKGSTARELAEQMARSLEEGHPDDAAQSGRSSIGSLDEAKKMLQSERWFEDPSGDRRKLVEDARRKLDAESRWAEEQTRELRRRAADRAREPLQRGGEEEQKMADRARELAEKGGQAASFPQQAVESLDEAARSAREAADALRRGDADRGLDRQREAQRQLEAAREQLQDDAEQEGASKSNGEREGDNGGASRDSVAIPGAKEHKGPEEFRRRVMQGLGQRSNSALRDAVQRYAEGLLR